MYIYYFINRTQLCENIHVRINIINNSINNVINK